MYPKQLHKALFCVLFVAMGLFRSNSILPNIVTSQPLMSQPFRLLSQIRDAIRSFPSECENAYDDGFLRTFKEVQIGKSNQSSAVLYRAKAIHASDEDWTAYVFHNATLFSTHIEVPFSAQFFRSLDRTKNAKDDTLHRFLRGTREGRSTRRNVRQKALILVDIVDHFNWWWLLVVVTNHFTLLMAVVEALCLDVEVGIVHLSEDGREKNRLMPLRMMHHALFSSHSIPRLNTTFLREHESGKPYRHIIVLPTRENPSILKNIRHPKDACSSPIVCSFRHHVLKQVNPYPSSTGNAVCWMYRRPSILSRPLTWWQRKRSVQNQDELIERLGLVKLDLEDVEIHTQLRLAGSCGIMIGVHGAGLNLAFAMARPIVLELTPGTIANRNAPNLMAAIKGCVRSVPVKFPVLDARTIGAQINQTLRVCAQNLMQV